MDRNHTQQPRQRAEALEYDDGSREYAIYWGCHLRTHYRRLIFGLRDSRVGIVAIGAVQRWLDAIIPQIVDREIDAAKIRERKDALLILIAAETTELTRAAINDEIEYMIDDIEDFESAGNHRR